MEKLKAHLTRTKTRQLEFARSLGISQSYVSEMLSGKRTPSLAMAGRIASATKGRVPVSAWIKPEESE